jgi:enediyne polyketide synthase
MSTETLTKEWNESLFGVYLERKLNEFFPETNISVAFLKDENPERQARSEQALHAALREKTTILRRSDGKPETMNGSFVSASHAEHLTLAVAARATVGCDIELLVERDGEIWKDLLGEENFKLAQLISTNSGLSFSAGATKVWTAVECLKKCAIKAPLLMDSNADNWTVFISGSSRIYVTEAQINGFEPKVIIGVLANKDDASI